MSIEVLSDPSIADNPRTSDGGRAPSDASGRPARKPPRRSWILRLLLLGTVVAAITAAAIWVPGTFAKKEEGPRLTHRVTRGDLIVSVIEQGTLESAENKEITCDVRGYNMVTFVVESGTFVQKDDVLVQLDTKVIEETVSLQKTNAHIAQATLERTKADVAKNEIAIDAYLNGRFRSQMEALERQRAIAVANLETAQKLNEQSLVLFRRGYATALDVEGNELAVKQATLELEVVDTNIHVLETYTKKMELVTLRGSLKASKSKLEADKAGLAMDEARRDRALEELEACVIKADRPGLVIYPSAAAWKDSPDIAEGVGVRKDQVLLLMPDLNKMQVKVGIHESMIDRVKTGLLARVTLPDRSLEAEVSSVSTIASPGGWWTGGVVEYDTIIKLPSEEGLKPGMTAEIEVVLARHTDVLTVPVTAIIETKRGYFCWVKTGDQIQKRSVKVGDSNDVFIIVEAGLKAGDDVIINPLTEIEEASEIALEASGEESSYSPDNIESQDEGEKQ